MIEPRLWLLQAKNLPVGSDDKIVHKGCGQRPSLWIHNDPDKWGCYCHRCRQSGFVAKDNPRVRVRVPPRTGYVPTDIESLMPAFIRDPMLFGVTLKNEGLTPYLKLLKFSKQTGRIYFPDQSDSYLGLDATGKANAFLYSPIKRRVCSFVSDNSSRGIRVHKGNLRGYLSSVRAGYTSLFYMDKTGLEYALACMAGLYRDHMPVELYGCESDMRQWGPIIS